MQRIAIIGAGAAGCFAAANIPFNKNREVVIFEKTSKALQKVKVSGGGRCNTTHACFDIPELIGNYPRGKNFLKKTLYRFSPKDTIDWFEERGVLLKAEADGRMFPDTDDSQTIINAIWQEMMKQQVQVCYNKSLQRVETKLGKLILYFADDSIYEADKVMIACGGFPKTDQYSWLKALGHTISEPAPSLFTFNLPKHPITQLMGVAVPNVSLKILGTKISEHNRPILITHWGLSGPCVLRTSAWAARELQQRNYEFSIHINWLNDVSEQDIREQVTSLRQDIGKMLVHHKNPFNLPKRLWEYFMQQSGIGENVRWGELPAAAQNKLIKHLVADEYAVKGKTTFKEEFVTCGGITLNEVDAQTMQSKLIPGLYFGGEILDVDGITGGFNFQHAWSSGFIAAESMVAG